MHSVTDAVRVHSKMQCVTRNSKKIAKVVAILNPMISNYCRSLLNLYGKVKLVQYIKTDICILMEVSNIFLGHAA